MLYEKVVGHIGVELSEFLDWNEKKYVPFIQRTGGKLIGLWTTMIGDIGTFLEIWAYEDFAAMGQASELFHSPSNEEDKQTFGEIPKYHKDKNIEILQGTSLSPVKGVLE